jgi:hypothetical protein
MTNSHEVVSMADFWFYALLEGNRLTGSVLDVTPELLNRCDHFRRHGNVVQIRCGFATVCVCPVEEFQDFGGICRLVLLAMHQDGSCAGNRPRILLGLIRQYLIERLAPISTRWPVFDWRQQADTNARSWPTGGSHFDEIIATKQA